MSRTGRTRTRNRVTGSGTTWALAYHCSPYAGQSDYGPFSYVREKCTDYTGTPWSDSPFTHWRTDFPNVSLSGCYPNGFFDVLVQNSPMWGSLVPAIEAIPTSDGVYRPAAYSNSQLGLMALANLNPARPVADLPVSIAELREIPELLRDSGHILFGHHHIPKNAAKANLMARFGFAPIISDLSKLLDFVSLVDRREKQLRLLNTTKPVHIKRRLGVQHWTTTANYTPWQPVADPSGTTNTARLRVNTTSDYWYTVRARLATLLSEREIQSRGFNVVFGLDGPSAAAIWALLPWSWLIDWFSTTGDLAAAFRGGMPVIFEGLNLMTRTNYDIQVSFPNGIRSGLTASMTNPQGKCVRHERTQITPVWTLPEFHIPYLDMGQWSILLSLFALRV